MVSAPATTLQKPDMADIQKVEVLAKVEKKNKEQEEIDRYDSAEEVDSDDMAGDLCDSDSDDGQERRALFKVARASKRGAAGTEPAASKFNQEFDTNVFEVKLDCLENKGEVATGDAHICSACGAVFSNVSKLTKDGEKQIWNCEFCNAKNEVNIDDEEIPKSAQVTYLLEAAPPKQVVEDDKGQKVELMPG